MSSEVGSQGYNSGLDQAQDHKIQNAHYYERDSGHGQNGDHNQGAYDLSLEHQQSLRDLKLADPKLADPKLADPLLNGAPRNSPTKTRTRAEAGGESDMPQDLQRQTPNGSKPTLQRTCKKCEENLTGQFVCATGGTFHLECFNCQDCGQVVASKFFPVDDESGTGQYPLCETDYFRRLDLLCFNCGAALRGSYVTALERKYHIEHFTCSVCPTAFGAKDSHYEHNGMVYCHYHYSTQFAQRCNGCQTAILKQFVEIFRNGQNQHWHPECYMINKFWTVKLATACDPVDTPEPNQDATPEQRATVRRQEEEMDDRVYRIWSVLSAFEESSAACISDMLLQVSNGAHYEGLMMAKKFIAHVELLFGAIDRLDSLLAGRKHPGLAYGREAKLLCKKIVAFFALLSNNRDGLSKRVGVTQDLLTLVTGLAHYLKLLIRIGLQGALKFEREASSINGLVAFLDELADMTYVSEESSLESNATLLRLAQSQLNVCPECQAPIDEQCLRIGGLRWHLNHLHCSMCHRDLEHGSDLEHTKWNEQERHIYCSQCDEVHQFPLPYIPGVNSVSRLQQFVFLLRIALARLLAVLKSSGALPPTTDDMHLTTSNSIEGQSMTGREPTMMSLESRSKSYGDSPAAAQQQSTLQDTVGEMKRLRSMRMEKRLSTSIKTARTSRIIDGPEAQSITSGLAQGHRDQKGNGFHIVEERDSNGTARLDQAYGHPGSLALDDIPRMVAAEQAKEQRPNAYRHARNGLLSPDHEPRLHGVDQRRVKWGGESTSTPGPAMQRNKRYFSDLSGLEYFIVRTIAVLELQTLLKDHFNQEELMSLIETNRKPTFWNKFGKAFKNDKIKAGKKKGVFGVGLETLVERDGTDVNSGVGSGYLRVPTLLDDAISAMRQMDMSVEGVFRKNGNIRRLKELAERLDSKEDVDLSKESPVQVAALLKKFLRELPDPLLTHKLHDLFSASQKLAKEEDAVRVLHLTCCLLPKAHRDAVEMLFSFLNWAASFSHIDEESGSKMNCHNLATVITPNILCNEPTKAAGVSDSLEAIEAVDRLIAYNEMMCEVPEEVVAIALDKELFTADQVDITTKEILKRYGEVSRSTGGQYHTVNGTKSPDSKGSRFGSPILTRVDTDPHQATAWQKETSVRHIQQNGTPSFPKHRQSTPPQHSHDFAPPTIDYHRRGGSTESAGSFNSPSRQRQAGQSKSGTPDPSGNLGIS